MPTWTRRRRGWRRGQPANELIHRRMRLREGESPAEKPIGIVPLFGLVEVEPGEPTAFVFGRINWRGKSVDDRRGKCNAHVGRQAREQVRRSAKVFPQVGLLAAGGFPRRELTEDDPAI